jgi:hypothetical protein
MTPCRVVDTRNGQGFTGFFGPPALAAGVFRTFPIQSSTNCSIPAIAQAYSFNITVIPSGFLDFITVWPTGAPQPNASTLNGYVGTVIANAAIVPAGTSGQVNVYASQNTHLIIDINGYYAAQTGITLAQGTAASPSMSFADHPQTGIFSPGGDALAFSTSGAERLSIDSTGNVGIGQSLHVEGITSLGPPGSVYAYSVAGASPGPYPTLGFNTYGYPYVAGANGYGGVLQYQNGDGKLIYYTGSNVTAGQPHAFLPALTIDKDGSIGIGTTPSSARLAVDGGSPAVYGRSDSAFGAGVVGRNDSSGDGVVGSGKTGDGVRGDSNGGNGVYGNSTNGPGVQGFSLNGTGVLGRNGNGLSWAGYFDGNVRVTGTLTQGSDARLKQGLSNLNYGLRELMQLRPVTYEWKDKPEQGIQLGLIAQEVETVLPELVSTDKDAEQTKGLNYIGLVPVTIKAIQ